MAVKELDKKLNALLTKGDNTWEVKARERVANKQLFRTAQNKAIKLLQYMKKNGITKQQLAVDLCIDNETMSTMLKGQWCHFSFSAQYSKGDECLVNNKKYKFNPNDNQFQFSIGVSPDTLLNGWELV